MKKQFLTLATIALTTTLCAAPGDIVFTETRSPEEEALFPSKTDQFIIVDVSDDDTITRGQKKNTDTINEKQFEEYAHTFLKKQLTLNQMTWEQLPKEKQESLSTIIKNVCAQCRKDCKRNAMPSIKKNQLNTRLLLSLEKVYKSESTILVIDSVLAKTVDDSIVSLFKTAGIAPTATPAIMKNEFTQRRNHIILTLKRRMLARKTSTVSLAEIENLVDTLFDTFIERIERIFVWNWVDAELHNLKQEDKERAKTSSITPYEPSKKLHEQVQGLRKKS